MRLSIYVLALLAVMTLMEAASIEIGRFAIGAFLFAFILPIILQQLRLSIDESAAAPRYLPSMIIGRSNVAAEQEYRAIAEKIYNAPFLLWCLAGALLILPPFLVYDHEHGALRDIAIFLKQNFDLVPAWQGAFFDIALQKAAAILLIGAGVWNSFSLGLFKQRLFLIGLTVMFLLSAFFVFHGSSLVFQIPDLSLRIIILMGLLVAPLWMCRENLYSLIVSCICAAVMVVGFVCEIASLSLYLCGWMIVGYVWGLSRTT